MRILLVEDDEVLVQLLVHHLTAQCYAIDIAMDGIAGLHYAQSAAYDLIVLDVDLPKLDGIQLCRQLRQEKYEHPILLLTAKGQSSDKVMGLDAGADDYVVKPCTVEELSARIRALLRRHNKSTYPILEWGGLQLDPVTCEVSFKGEVILLSRKEYSLLELLLRNPQRMFNSSMILEHLWTFEDMPGEETVRSHIKRLRRKLKAAGVDDPIDTVYGMGYRLKPAAAPATPPVNAQEEARSAVIAAWEQFREPTMERVILLDQAVAALQAHHLPVDLRQAAQSAAHKLAGSLAMFGFPAGSRLGREIEQWFQAGHGPESLYQLRNKVRELHQILQQPPRMTEDEEPIVANIARTVTPALNTSYILLVDDDEVLATQLQTEAIRRGLAVSVAGTIAEARTQLNQQLPQAILLDLMFSHQSEQGLLLLEELATQHPNLPVLVFSVRDDFSDRLAVARRGRYQFISKSTPLPQVLQTIEEILQIHALPEVRVLAVDDDPLVLARLEQCLPQWGIHLITLQDPWRIWQSLESIVPDLLIMDIDMPEVSGIEVCRVIRADNAWSGLPILFLTTHRDTATILQLYDAGADDYVAKPFTEPELITRIFNRLERNRLLRNLAETDPLTGIANRHRATKALNRFLDLAQRQEQPLCLAVIDLDRFKQINDSYGHEVGDRVLKRIAGILQQHLRSDDVVARWGGEEFLVGMYGMTQDQALERLNQVLEVVRQETFAQITSDLLHLTFSAGIAVMPEHGSDLQSLYRAADAAMYRAKAEGRDRIHLAE